MAVTGCQISDKATSPGSYGRNISLACGGGETTIGAGARWAVGRTASAPFSLRPGTGENVKPLLGILSILALGCSAHQTSQRQAGKTGEPESSILSVEAVTVSARGEGVSLPVVSGLGEEGVIITHDDVASAVAISRDGRSIASAGPRGTVALCQVQSPGSSSGTAKPRARAPSVRREPE